MNELFNFIYDEYAIKPASDIESTLLDMLDNFIEQTLEAELEQHLGYSRYHFLIDKTLSAKMDVRIKRRKHG